jgi:hypothetical protein
MMFKSAKQVMNAVTQLKLPPNKPTKSPATSGPKLELITAICARARGEIGTCFGADQSCSTHPSKDYRGDCSLHRPVQIQHDNIRIEGAIIAKHDAGADTVEQGPADQEEDDD